MQAQQLVITEVGHIGLEPYDPGRPGPGEVLYRSLVTLISTGTEGARFSGLQPTAFPFAPGYAAVGEVLEVGSQVTDVAPGDRIFTYGNHASIARTKTLYAKLPDGLAPERAVFARLANVALTAIRVSDVALGDSVAVIGLGLVGNCCAQLFELAGAEVMGLDLSPRRRAIAAACGIRQVLEPGDDGGVAAVLGATGGEGARCTVEAVGIPALVMTACQMTGRRGEVILLGSPRGACVTDVTPLLDQVHLWGNGCVTLKGAHEWRFPAKPSDGVRWSLLGGCRFLLQQIAAGRLRTEPLLTHTVSPHDAPDIYPSLGRKDEHLGIVFDWSRL